MRSGQIVATLFEGYLACITPVTFSPDGGQVGSVSDDNTVQICDTKIRQIVAEPFEGHTQIVKSVRFSEGSQVVSGSGDLIAQI